MTCNRVIEPSEDSLASELFRGTSTLAQMATEEAREAAAASLRTLNHTFAGHDLSRDELASIATVADGLTRAAEEAPRRDRLTLMRNRSAGSVLSGEGFEDRAVGGSSNPTSVDLKVRFEEVDVVADVVLRRAFEGAPGRAHGGIVAAAFDDVTGFVIGKLQEPAFTGELTVRYLAAVPVEETLEIRARLDGRERRKLYISAEMSTGGTVVATCRAIYITVDPSRFAGAPDPR